MTNTQRAYLEIHIAVLFFGFSAILGDLISLSATVLVWWRVLLASLGLFVLLRFGQALKGIPKEKIALFMGIGVLTGLHWMTFFGAIKLSNPSVTLICMATATFFTSFIEPFLLKRPFVWYEIALGAIIIPGMALIVGGIPEDMLIGVGVGLFSAFLAAFFGTLNKKYIQDADPMSISFLELSSAWIFVSVCLIGFTIYGLDFAFWPVGLDWLYLSILAFLCTTLAYVLTMRSLRYLSAFVVSLSINLEPIYGILIAFFFLDDSQELDSRFYIGCLVILAAVFLYPVIKRRMEKGTA